MKENDAMHLKANKVECKWEDLKRGKEKYIKVVAIIMYFSSKIKCI